MLVRHFFVKIYVIKSLDKFIKCHIWKLQASQKILTLFDCRQLNRRVDVNVGDRKVCIKNLVEFFLSYCNSEKIPGAIPVSVWSYHDWSHIAKLRWDNFDFDVFAFVLLLELSETFLPGRAVLLGPRLGFNQRNGINNKVEEGFNFAIKWTVELNWKNTQSLSFL